MYSHAAPPELDEKPSMWSRDTMSLKVWIEVLPSVVQLYETSGDKEMVYTF